MEQNMNGLVLFSHGSLLCGARETLREHAARLSARGVFPVVETAFLNYNRPTFPEAAAACREQGVSRALVVPYFLVPGKFVTTDLPAEIEAVRAACPDVEFVVAEPIGFDPRMADALLDMAAAAPAVWDQRAQLKVPPELCEDHSKCPQYGTPACPLDSSRALAESGHRPGLQPDPSPSASRARASQAAVVEALAVLVHGSPRPAANKPMHQVVELIRARGRYPIVEVGFLECNDPLVPGALDRCVQRGAGRVVAVPYFVHPGKHVAEDLPNLLEEAQGRHPGVEFRLADFVGRSPLVTDILADRARAAAAIV
jgi:sirohydrochlorin ferrochelatase